MLLMGPVSSLFDFITLPCSGLYSEAGPCHWRRSAVPYWWFLESLCSQTLVVYVIRTIRSFHPELANKLLLLSTSLILGFAFALPFTPLGSYFGFEPMPSFFFVILAGIMLAYLTMVSSSSLDKQEIRLCVVLYESHSEIEYEGLYLRYTSYIYAPFIP